MTIFVPLGVLVFAIVLCIWLHIPRKDSRPVCKGPYIHTRFPDELMDCGHPWSSLVDDQCQRPEHRYCGECRENENNLDLGGEGG